MPWSRIPELLREARERRGLLQEQLARRIHATEPTVSRYETGARQIPLDMLARLVEELGCPELAHQACRECPMSKVRTAQVWRCVA